MMIKWVILIFCLGSLLFVGARGAAQNAGNTVAPPSSNVVLQKAQRVEMVQWKSDDARPFFRVQLRLVDANGAPAKLQLPDNLREQIQVTGQNGEECVVVRADSQARATQRRKNSEILLVLDASGSMNKSLDGQRTRFAAAQEAARELLRNFQDGDSAAVVTFESRRVKETIEAAAFKTSQAEVFHQIASLPRPDSKGNTALYSATNFALDLLKKRRAQAPDKQYLLVVLTDGVNDVRPCATPQAGKDCDDAGLLKEEGLEVVKKAAADANVEIYTIGMGQPGRDFNEKALKDMVYPPGNKQYFQAQDTDALKNVLAMVEQSFNERLTVTFFPRRQADFHKFRQYDFQVRLKGGAGPDGQSEMLSWISKSLTDSVPDGRLTADEEKELLQLLPLLPSSGSPWMQMLRMFGIGALLAGLLVFLWFVPPRLLWPGLAVPTVGGKTAPKTVPVVSAGTQTTVPPKPRQRFEETRVFDIKPTPPEK